MFSWPLLDRLSRTERMDDPDLPPADHRLALAGLERLNRASRAAAIIADPILHMARRTGLRHLRLLDVACGGGDVPVQVAAHLRAAGLSVHLTLTDKSDTALAQAAARAAAAGLPATTTPGDAPHYLPDGEFDVVTNSLFLHHLWAKAVTDTLAAMKARAARLLVVSDLRRSAAGYAVAWTTCRLLSRSPVVHFDGPVSVLAAWTPKELAALARDAGLAADGRLSLRHCWPWRMLLTWEPTAPATVAPQEVRPASALA